MKLRKISQKSSLLQKLHGYGDFHVKHNGDVFKDLNKSMQSSYIQTLRNDTKQNLNEAKKYSQKSTARKETRRRIYMIN